MAWSHKGGALHVTVWGSQRCPTIDHGARLLAAKPSDSKQRNKQHCHLGDRFFEHLDCFLICAKERRLFEEEQIQKEARRKAEAQRVRSVQPCHWRDGLQGLLSRCPSLCFARVMVVAPANHIDLPQMNRYMFWAKSIKNHQKSIHWIWKIGGKFIEILGIWNSAPNSEMVTGITILAV